MNSEHTLTANGITRHFDVSENKNELSRLAVVILPIAVNQFSLHLNGS